MTTIKERILQIPENQNISKKDFFNKFSISYSNFKGENLKSALGTDTIVEILTEFPNINPEWLIIGKGSMYKDSKRSIAVPTDINSRIKAVEKHFDSKELPIYEMKASAGLVENIQDFKSLIPIDSIKLSAMPKCDGGIHIYGDSMYPLIRNGDIVFYKEVQKDFNNIIWGNIYLVSYYIDGDHYLVCKYIQKSENKNAVTLHSYNKNHQPFDILFDDIRELAIVKASFQRYFQ